MSSRPKSGQGSKSTSRNITPTAPTPIYPIPPLAAIFLTHFHDTKGQSVVHYISNDEIRRGNIEHTTLPSGLHSVEEDSFGFRHGNASQSGAGASDPTESSTDVGANENAKGKEKGNGNGRGDGTWPGVALFRSRMKEAGRGRRMISLGVVLEMAEEIFELKPWLEDLYDFLEANQHMEGAMESLSDPLVPASSNTGRKMEIEEVDGRIIKILEGLWGSYGCSNPPISWRDGQGRDKEGVMKAERGLRSLANGAEVSDQHPIRYLPRLVDLLGPSIVTVYKAAITGQKILIYSPPPLLPISAFGWLIAALSLPPSSVTRPSTQWVGQVGLMDLTELYARGGAWVASTSDKILLSHTKLYDLSIDLSSCNPLPNYANPDPGSDSDTSTNIEPSGQAILHTTSPSSPNPILATYSFADIPLYRLISTTTSSDWWITMYNLFDKVYTLCAGVCEYAVGRGQVGSISLRADIRGSGSGSGSGYGQGDDEEDDLLQDEDQDEDDERDGKGNEETKRGQMILRQFYHHSFHLHALLEAVITPGQAISIGQLRQLTGKWFVSGDDWKFWSSLAGRWQGVQS